MTHRLNPNITRFVAATLLVVLAATGTVFGEYHRVGRVEAFETDTWTVWTGRGDTRVVVDGDGDTDLDCYVYDMAGRLLGKDDDGTDYCIVDFSRSRSGNIEVRVTNLGEVWNRYELTVD